MIYINREYYPALEKLGDYIRNPLFMQFCLEIKTKYQCKEKIEFSSCSWEFGWNVKFKKAGKNLCIIYPRAVFYRLGCDVTKRESACGKNLHECTTELREIYGQTKTGNGQKWLMIDLEDKEKNVR